MMSVYVLKDIFRSVTHFGISMTRNDLVVFSRMIWQLENQDCQSVTLTRHDGGIVYCVEKYRSSLLWLEPTHLFRGLSRKLEEI